MTETIGQRLKRAREYRHLTLEKAAEATRIRLMYLQALESDDFSSMPSPVQARGFLRNYAQYLDLDLDQMIEELRIAKPQSEEETSEVVFEGEQQKTSAEADSMDQTVEDETSQEPFWQTWLRRNRRESGALDEDPASQPSLKPAPVFDAESSSEAEAGLGNGDEANEKDEGEVRRAWWSVLWERVNRRIPRKKITEPPALEEPVLEPEPESGIQPENLTEPSPSSQEIINQIGLQLRQRREMISLSLEEIERHTRMRAQFLEALEKGNFDELPSPVQTRGMLSNYASFLDMDVDEVLLQFAEALQALHRERHPEGTAGKRSQPKIPGRVPTLRSFIAGDITFGVVVISVLVVFSIWGISRVITLQSEQQEEIPGEATAPSISEALIGTPIETVEAEVTLIPAEDTPIPDLPEGTIEIPTPALDVNVQINIVAVERTFMRVTVDGEIVFDARTIPGNAYPFEAEESIEVLAGNGAALRLAYNQRDQGLLGGFGQVASFIYTADEILVPTPVIQPTPTNTPFVSPTPSITPSPTPTGLPVEEVE